ncbi:hypothetical protein [Brevifollis gellanilyticus]|uniref:Uncharacterized protein n=1 Tax=Brevifollis gellanilyticus TaxID=748831 RepID=A0A512M6X9_9BACT|nr:hypothetical protein [Brevifollis gellanilyticus]GEP42492.1 hypothetical protein BGE01nite_17830 [Brevifollis gellanilyticus]
MKKTLAVYGSLGTSALRERIGQDWSHVSVLEMDAFLPEALERAGARKVLEGPMMNHPQSTEQCDRVRLLLDKFLEERCVRPGIDTRRVFRAASLDAMAFRMATAYIWSLEQARKLADMGGWERILVSPGAGVSTLAWRQLAQAMGAEFEVLPESDSVPPLAWRLRRKWRRWRMKSAPGKKAGNAAPSLPLATSSSPWVCADPRLDALLARGGDAWPWHRMPSFAAAGSQELTDLKREYSAWWKDWWQDWMSCEEHRVPLHEGQILESVGQHYALHVYPLHSVCLSEARRVMAGLNPKRLLVGAMRGKKELMWLLAAQERGLETAACTLDDHLDPLIAFNVEQAYCDDERQHEMALDSGMKESQITMVRTHRAPALRERRQHALRPGQRGQIVLAGTYFSGQRIAACPRMNLWSLRLLVETARLLPGHDFHVKPHPVRERPQEPTNWTGFHHVNVWQMENCLRELKAPPNVIWHEPEVSLAPVMDKSDILLNIESYAAFEAYALGIPVIHVCPVAAEQKAFARQIELGAAQVAETPEALAELVRRNLEDASWISARTASQQEFLRGFFHTEGPLLHEAASMSPKAV